MLDISNSRIVYPTGFVTFIGGTMQIDFHYYGTYTIARAAGIKEKTAHIIANSAQFVDDCVDKSIKCNFKDGSSIVPIITAHHGESIENLKRDDQRMVWVPFHFLPGNIGSEFTERLVCQKDSDIALQMLDHSLFYPYKPFQKYLVGITSHVYADTFAHYGFSGVSSRRNEVDTGSIDYSVNDVNLKKRMKKKEKSFFNQLTSLMIKNFRTIGLNTVEKASGALGHGAVATYPDKPFLKWTFNYDHPCEATNGLNRRDNVSTFLEACEGLYNYYKSYLIFNPDELDERISLEFADIKDSLREVLSLEGKKDERASFWKKAFRDKSIFDFPERNIPKYMGYSWIEDLKLKNHSETVVLVDTEVYNYFIAAEYHRTYILRDLLPKNNIVVV